MAQKVVFITGIAGLLGSNIAKLFRDKFYVVGSDIVDFNMENVEFFKYDLLDYDKLENNIISCHPQILIHTAAYVDVDGCESNPGFAYKLNVDLTRKLSEICAKIKCKLIYISSDSIYGGSVYESIENDTPMPINVYGITKLMGEYFVPENGIVLRTNIYGLNYRKKKSFAEWIISSLRNGETITMFDDVIFSPILVDDVAIVIEKMINENLSGIFNLCSSDSISKFEFAKLLKSLFEIKTGQIKRGKVKDFDFKARRQNNMAMNNHKISSILGIKMPSVEDGLEKFKSLIREQNFQEFGGFRNGI